MLLPFCCERTRLRRSEMRGVLTKKRLTDVCKPGAPDRRTRQRLMRVCTMFRFDASVGLLKRHAERRPLVLQRRGACAPDAHAMTTRCSGDAGQNLFRLSWSELTT
ncbi:hypothetical protein [Burkholderia sp. GS2Y]|uniref:Uncharacterized protein n=1 Tax=Burkholderia theae TaxID=3143496 RepID=A0ABU9WAH9_9BURK